MDAVVRWSPHSTPDQSRFVILNLSEHNLKLFQAERIQGSALHYHQLTQRSKLPTIRAFDWSPTDEALVAFGLPSGEATLLRIDDKSNELLSFAVKHQRLCNAVALSTKGLLAAGLDKVRNDFCLNIWDLEHRLASWDRRSTGWASARPQYDPVRKLATSETISSIKFFAQQPDTLVTGVKGQFVRIYDLRESPGNPVVQFATRCAHSLSIDPFDEHYFASASGTGEPIVCIWDRRVTPHASAAAIPAATVPVDSYQAGAVLELKNCLTYTDAAKPPNIWSVRYCKHKRASLGILGSNGQLQVFETEKEYSPPDANPPSHLLRTRLSRDVQYPYDDAAHGGTKDTRMVSFDFVPGPYRVVGYRADGNLEVFAFRDPAPVFDLSLRGDLVIAYRDQIKTIEPSPATDQTVAQMIQHLRAKRAAARAADDQAHQGQANGTANGTANGAANGAANGTAADVPPIRTRRDEWRAMHDLLGPSQPPLDIHDVLALGTVERRRAEAGYSLNCRRNIDILQDDPWLQDVWHWVAGAEDAAKDGGMVHQGLDLSYLGVAAIWDADLGPHFSSRVVNDGDGDGDAPTTTDFVGAVAAINRHCQRPDFDGVATAYPEQRNLCLAICGWALSPEAFEDELRRVEKEGPRMKAAAWAMFHDRPKRAIEALFKGSDAEKLVAMALAGYYGMAGLSKDGHDEAWATLCRDVAHAAHDPWSRAILALVSTKDWAAVVAEASLPLRDRVGVALRYFTDDQLTPFLGELTRDCIQCGDIEGLCLTGLTQSTLDLFHAYVAHTEDVQTAVLVLSFAVPLYIPPAASRAFAAWREAYRARLDQGQLHTQRALYDTHHTKKSRTQDGRILIRPPPRQVTVRCNFCDGSMAHEADPAASAVTRPEGSRPTSAIHPGNPLAGPGASAGTTCTRCHRHLPRCGVCMMWLGVPDPARPGGSAAVAQEDPMARFLNFCNICHHGYHANHARDWFATHQMCPVPECTCLCNAT